MCDVDIRTLLLITWATVQSPCLKTKVSGRFLMYEKAFLICVSVMLLRETDHLSMLLFSLEM